MDLITLGNNIKILFQKVNPEQISDIFQNNTILKKGKQGFKEKLSYRNIPEDLYSNYAFSYYSNNSFDEREILFKETKLEYGNPYFDSHFNLLANFGEKTIELNGNIPLVNFDHIIEWRDTSHKIGQAIIVTAFLAKKSLLDNVDYEYWDWPTALKCNNRQLQNVLNRGISENHYHLNGSTQIFPISWVCIMNNPTMIPSRVQKIISNLNPRLSFGQYDNLESWENLLKNAAICRLELFERIRIGNETKKGFSKKPYVSYTELEDVIKQMSFLYAYKTEQNKYLDYALLKDLSVNNYGYNRIVIGERKFLYDCFKASFSGTFTERENNLFYYYLLVKNQFRGEIIQSNDMPGFKNFAKYQDRKEYFFEGVDKYEREAVRLSLNDTLKYQSIKSLEARIMPKRAPHILQKSIDFYDGIYREACKDKDFGRSLENTFEDNLILKLNSSHLSGDEIGSNNINVDLPYFYVLHYPKKTTKLNKNQMFLPCAKNAKQRRDNEFFSKSIASLLSEKDYFCSRIRGIDTCSFEIGCRPEVFATDYRYLKNYHSNKKHSFHHTDKNNFLYLGRTYHAGEDFLDLVDGMRAIDETIQFLDFSHGDRIGHALALGLIPKEHYNYKGNKVRLNKQDALDNFIWLYYRSSELNIAIEPLLEHQLCDSIDVLSREIYGEFCENNNVVLNKVNLYCSWKLRGDSPDLYRKGKFEAPKVSLNQYTKAKYIDSVELDSYRNDANISKLYYAYHFDADVRRKEEEPYEFSVNKKYVNLVTEVQKKLQLKIAENGIMIECNPSSNFLISTFKDYKKHPITVFNNLELEIDSEKLSKCPQISVSINTDDQGVFDTSLEYEYALMASALIKDTDENGNPKYKPTQVYKYLDSIRQMGNIQTFLRDSRK